MKQFDLQRNEYDVQIKDMIEPISNWEYTYVYEGSRTCGKSYIQNLLDEKDKEIERLQSKNKKIQTILRTRARQDRKRKAKLRKLKLETTNQRLKLERLNNIIKQIYEIFKEGSFEDDCDCIQIEELITRELKGSDK